MEILIGFEHNYVMPYGVMLQSLVCNNKQTKIHVHAIIGDNVTEEDKKALRNILGEQNQICFYKFDVKEITNFPIQTWTHFRESCYYRLYAASILPISIEKILYLDGDMIVRHNLEDLWKTDVSSFAVAGTMNQTEDVKWHNRLHYSVSKGYVNNGVLLINLKYWREHELEKSVSQFILKESERIIMADQDVLNYIIQDKKLMLPLKYNVQENFFYQLKYMTFDYWSRKKEVDFAIQDPWILHYTGQIKPWMAECLHPMKEEFFVYQRQTPWRDFPLVVKKQKISIKTRLKNIVKRYVLLRPIPTVNQVENKFAQF